MIASLLLRAQILVGITLAFGCSSEATKETRRSITATTVRASTTAPAKVFGTDGLATIAVDLRPLAPHLSLLSPSCDGIVSFTLTDDQGGASSGSTTVPTTCQAVLQLRMTTPTATLFIHWTSMAYGSLSANATLDWDSLVDIGGGVRAVSIQFVVTPTASPIPSSDVVAFLEDRIEPTEGPVVITMSVLSTCSNDSGESDCAPVPDECADLLNGIDANIADLGSLEKHAEARAKLVRTLRCEKSIAHAALTKLHRRHKAGGEGEIITRIQEAFDALTEVELRTLHQAWLGELIKTRMPLSVSEREPTVKAKLAALRTWRTDVSLCTDPKAKTLAAYGLSNDLFFQIRMMEIPLAEMLTALENELSIGLQRLDSAPGRVVTGSTTSLNIGAERFQIEWYIGWETPVYVLSTGLRIQLEVGLNHADADAVFRVEVNPTLPN